MFEKNLWVLKIPNHRWRSLIHFHWLFYFFGAKNLIIIFKENFRKWSHFLRFFHNFLHYGVFVKQCWNSLLEVILGLLQPLHSVDLWSEADESGPKWFPIPKNIGMDTKNKSPAWVTISLLEVIFGLLQPLHPLLDLQVGLRLLKMVPNDFPWPKTWCLTPKSSL